MPLCRKSKTTTVGKHFNYNVNRKHLTEEEEKEEKEFMCAAFGSAHKYAQSMQLPCRTVHAPGRKMEEHVLCSLLFRVCG